MSTEVGRPRERTPGHARAIFTWERLEKGGAALGETMGAVLGWGAWRAGPGKGEKGGLTEDGPGTAGSKEPPVLQI